MDQAEGLRNIIKKNNLMSASAQPAVKPQYDQTQYTHPQRPLARVITVTSGKGGVGKSNVSVNLAVQMKKRGLRVVILDADFGLANIEIMFGTVPEHNLSDLIYKGKSMKDIITWGPGGVGFISGGSGIAGLSNLSREDFTYIVQNLAELDTIADVIIVDTGAGISDAVLEFLVAGGEIILVTTPEPTSITDSYSLLKMLNSHPRFQKESAQLRVLTNRVESEKEGRALFDKLNAVVSKYLKLPMSHLGSVPQDNQLVKAVLQQTPVSLQSENAKSTRAFMEITDRLLAGETASQVKKRGIAAFFSHIVTGK
ncbi:MAG: MinD/ParA family protein [Lachnospiraceae bacterium]|jgi:flagellar biosynthesis protein FlhG|nr:MinD/ParA family protein [Lachnospiraceae bacterium]